MLVHIVYVPTADLRGPDLDRIGTVEDVPDDVGRMLIGEGSARVPTDDEAAAYREAQQVEEKAADVPADGQQQEEPARAPRVDAAGGRRSRPATQTEPAAEAAQ